jgi:aminopeptidase N
MRKWAIDESDQGPLALGYRLGHVRDDGRAFRAVMYNKGAAVLHMLRRLVGDEVFFLGVRRFYADWRYDKASSEDLRHAMEAESGRSLGRFFERWVYDSTLPQLKFSYRLQDDQAGHRELVLRVEQVDELFDVPITILVEYSDRPTEEVLMTVSERTNEMKVPLSGLLKRVDVSKDDGTLADIQRK